MEIEQTTGKLWSTGEPFDLFELNFIPTMLDEFAYPDTEFPGVYENSNGKEVMRFYAIDGDKIYYYDAVDTGASGSPKSTSTGVTYLSDGTAVEDRVTWAMPTLSTSDKVKSVTKSIDAETGLINYSTETEITATVAMNNLDWIQLPVVRGILFGDEAMVKLNVEGVSDAPKMIVKPLGSSGVADPLDQRQSVGFRVDGFGLAIKRPEAVCVTYGLCRNAALAALAYSTADVMYGDYTLMHNDAASTDVNYINEDINEQVMNVDGVNSKRVFVKFNANTNYSEGTFVEYQGAHYVFIKGHKGAWSEADVKEVNPVIVE
jgi:hypothetical protein